MGSNTSFSSGKVVGTVLGAVPEGVKALLPTEANLKQQIRRTQTVQQRVFISGTTAAELEILHELTVNSNGLLFLQKDFHTIEGKRVLIFGTDSILDHVNHPSVSVAFADGTFKISLKEFAQIWIVRVCVKGVNIPVLYAMLENKSGSSYSAVLEFLRQRCPLFIPDIFVVDFEAAEHKSI